MRIFTLACLTLLSTTAFAQPSEAEFPDFTHTDINGNSHHLYGYLDAGKTVIIDIMATWCPLCVNSVPGVESIWDTHGPDGDDTMMVLRFERDASTTNEAAWASTHGVNSPIITGAESLVADTWNISYQPRYFVICPDRSWQFHSGSINSNSNVLLDLAASCAPPLSVAEADLSGLHLHASESQVHVHGNTQPVAYQVLALNGQTMLDGTLDAGRTTIDASSLTTGVYLLRAVAGTEVKVLRFVKR